MQNTHNRQKGLSILTIEASGRGQASVSRQLTQELIDALEQRYRDTKVTRRDLNSGVGFVSEEWIAANFTAEQERSTAQQQALAESDALVAELEQADVIVIGAPMYNFGIPASLKAWVDMIARARKTFRYTDNGPEGLLKGKKAYIVLASGGVALGSAADFATPYLRHVLGFIGITDVDLIAADQLNMHPEASVDSARARIAELVFTTTALDKRAA